MASAVEQGKTNNGTRFMLVKIMAQLRKHFPNCESIFSENYKQYASTGQYYGPVFMPKTRKKESRSNEHWKLFVIL